MVDREVPAGCLYHLISLSKWHTVTDVAISTFKYTYDNEGNRESREAGPARVRGMVLDLSIISR